MTGADAFVIVATGVAWWSLVPQIVKLLRTGDASGVSTAWPTIGLVSNLGWTAYLLGQTLWAAVPSTAVMTIFYGLVIWALARTGTAGRLRPGLGMGALWAVALGSTGAFAGVDAMGVVLASSYVVQFTPPVLAAWRSDRPSGVSAGTWRLIVVESALWGTYGWWNSDRPIVMYAVAGVVGGGLILARQASATRAPARAFGSDTTKQV
ncbi:MAG: PQ-loop domain-containing transporter [Acidimicrobiia bacterium]